MATLDCRVDGVSVERTTDGFAVITFTVVASRGNSIGVGNASAFELVDAARRAVGHDNATVEASG